MTLSMNLLDRTYGKGVRLSYDLTQLLVAYLLDGGADQSTGRVPRGLLAKCSQTYRVTKPAVTKVWK